MIPSPHPKLIVVLPLSAEKAPNSVLLGAGEGLDNLVLDGAGSLLHTFRGQCPKRMRNRYGPEVGVAEAAGMKHRGVQEGLSTDNHRGYPQVLKGHRVVHTARRAGPSIDYGGHHEVAAVGQRLYDVLGGGPGINKLVHYHGVLELVSPVQQLLDAQE